MLYRFLAFLVCFSMSVSAAFAQQEGLEMQVISPCETLSQSLITVEWTEAPEAAEYTVILKSGVGEDEVVEKI